jgi:hypothetical protein
MVRWLVLAALVAPGAVFAQVPTETARPPAQPDTGQYVPARARRAPGDTTAAADSSRAPKELVQWAEPDSTMNALLSRQGYTVTRYQGKRAVFDAEHHTLHLAGDGAVQREQTILVADTIVYNDSTKLVRAAAPPKDTIVLRDPSQGTSDLVALGGMEYDLVHRHGVVRELSTSSAQGGQTWYVSTDKGAVQGDTTGHGGSVSYAEDGSITSCDLPYPHYHFQSKEIKMVSKHIMVARPAVLYIGDVPVMWLPFIFQDMRGGRHSGILTPRFGLTDVIRSSAGYTREIDNLGYYFALNDYMDATVSLDWRSGNSEDQNNIGWTRYNAEWQYRWLDRFLNGRVSTSYSTFSDGRTQFDLGWQHQQQFSQSSSINANINYTSNTSTSVIQAYTVAQTLATISSALNLQKAIGPANFSLGGTRTQYTGRKEVNQNFPNLSVSTKPVNITSWLLWSPQLSLNNTQTFNLDIAPFVFRPQNTPAGFDSTQVKADQRTTTISFQTPLRIGGFNWQNSFQVTDNEENFPHRFTLVDVQTGDIIGTRTFARKYSTSIDWQTGISLPVMLQGTLNLTPSVSIVNADPSTGFWYRSSLSGGRFLHQSKTFQYTLSSSPTLFGFFPGFGPFTRIRHSIQPQLSFSYAPATRVNDDLLRAQNRSRASTITGLQRMALNMRLTQTFEAKLRSPNDTNPEGGEKIKLLTLDFSSITYDFERKRKGLSGIATPTFSYRVASDLLPGLDLSVDYSLFQGDINSDSARFKPFRTGISASLTLGRKNNPFAMIARIFGHKPAAATSDTTGAAPGGGDTSATQVLNQRPQNAGPLRNRYQQEINTAGGWTASFTFTSSRSRPVAGATVYDPRSFCQQFIAFPVTYQSCLNQPAPRDTLTNDISGGQIFIPAAQATLRSNVAFDLTPKWAMQWTTGYDFERHEFSDQAVTLQRDMHDWRANMSFTRAPNGNFAFSFFISLKAEPDLKFDYHRNTYRPPSTQ